jgi:hypothetical protein
MIFYALIAFLKLVESVSNTSIWCQSSPYTNFCTPSFRHHDQKSAFVNGSFFSVTPFSSYNVSLNASQFRGKTNFYLFGNSVTRHYAFEILRFIDPIAHKSVDGDRLFQKMLCSGVLGMDSCDLYSLGEDTLIRFTVLETLPAKPELSFDPQKVFENAKASDVLIIGSRPLGNGTVLPCADRRRDGRCVSYWCEEWYSNIHNARPHGVLLFLEWLAIVFPGRIIWHSYSYLQTSMEVGACPWVNDCRSIMSEVIKCGIRMFNHKRVEFIDLAEYLKVHKEGYQDIVHHHGKLSEFIIKMMLSTLMS